MKRSVRCARVRACFLILFPLTILLATDAAAQGDDPEQPDASGERLPWGPDASPALEAILEDAVLEDAAAPDESGSMADADALSEELDDRAEQPLDLNTARVRDLAELPHVGTLLARMVVARRRLQGRFTSYDSLSVLPGMDDQAMHALRRYTRLITARARSAPLLEIRSRMRQEDRARAGFTDGRFAGDRRHISLRLRTSPAEWIDAGVATDKDAGEASYTDHVAMSVHVRGLGAVEHIVAGDFTVSASQGLVFAKPWGYARGSEAGSVLRASSAQIAPRLSTSEFGAFRGAGVQMQLGPAGIIAFVSDAPFDARIDSMTGSVASIDRSGLHRTSTEILRTNTARERTAGARIEAVREGAVSLRGGVSGWVSSFSRAISAGTQGAFSGSRAWMLGCDAEAGAGDAALHAEFALSHTGSAGGLAGADARLSRTISADVAYRRYPAAFHSLHGFAFGARSGTRNEEGLWLGLRWSASRDFSLRAGFDRCRFPARTSDLPMQSMSSMSQISVEWRAHPHVRLSARLRAIEDDRAVPATDAEGREARPITVRGQEHVRFELAVRASARSLLRVRIEKTFVHYDAYVPREAGFLVFAEAQLRPWSACDLSARMTGFDTRSYDSRLYLSEQDVPGSGTMGAYYGSGMRLSVSAGWRMQSAARMSVSYGLTVRSGTRMIGTGEDAVAGDALGTVSVQMDVRM